MLDKVAQIINSVSNSSLKSYFPRSFKLLNNQHTDLDGDKIHIDENETNYYKSKIKNLDLEVFIIENNEVNAFTIPGVDNISLLKSDCLKYQLIGLELLSKHPLDAELINGEIIFNSNIKNFKVLVFLHSGLIKKLKNIDDRFAVVLHELGHWVYIKNLISSNTYQNFLDFTKPTFYASILSYNIYSNLLIPLFTGIATITLLAITNIKDQQNEYDADSFVKRMGYSKNLQNALSILAYNKSKKMNDDKNDILKQLSFSILNLIKRQSHPPIEKRILALNESVEIFNDLKNLLVIIDKLILANNGALCKFIY